MKVNISIGSSAGTSVLGVLYIALIVFKLLGVASIVAISWWWVLLWPLIVVVCGVLILAITCAVGLLLVVTFLNNHY